MEHDQIPNALKSKDDLHLSTDSPLHGDAAAHRFSSDSPNQRQGDTLKKVSRTSGGADRSVEQSPLHRNQAKSSWERKGSSEGAHGVAPNTPGRFKPKTSGRGDESPENGTAVPKFGEWDESNPATGDGFTDIFEKVRAEKQSGSAKVPQITDDSKYMNSYAQSGSHKSSSCSCFSWFK